MELIELLFFGIESRVDDVIFLSHSACPIVFKSYFNSSGMMLKYNCCNNQVGNGLKVSFATTNQLYMFKNVEDKSDYNIILKCILELPE